MDVQAPSLDKGRSVANLPPPPFFCVGWEGDRPKQIDREVGGTESRQTGTPQQGPDFLAFGFRERQPQVLVRR